MIREIFITSVLLILSVINLILHKNKINIVKSSVGFFFVLVFVVFGVLLKNNAKLSTFISDYMFIYEIVAVALSIYLSLTLISKKVTKNITEYDFFELEKSYNDLRDDREKLRQRYLSTISLIDEGIIFYENGTKDVILSDQAHEIFGGKQSLSFETHALSVSPLDRDEYIKTISKVSKNYLTYEVKYRIAKGDEVHWVLERGHYIGVGSKKSIIATIKELEVKKFKDTSYFDVDSMYSEDKMYPVLKELTSHKKAFSFIVFELTNLETINEKYGREIGSLMMNEYVKYLKIDYQKDINRMFRLTGIRYAMIIDDYRVYEDFHKNLINSQSPLYTAKIQIAGIKDVIEPNFGVLNIAQKSYDSVELLKLANKLLDEAIKSPRKNFTIFGD